MSPRPPEAATTLVFICDRGALSPTALALWSALTHASRPIEAVLVGLDLDDSDRARVSAIADRFLRARLRHFTFDINVVGELPTPRRHISRATYARLFLHRYLDGPVLYLDGDVLVTGDLTDIGGLVPAGTVAAGANDYGAANWCALQASGNPARRAAPSGWTRLGDAAAGYVNAGMLWLDLDAIRHDPATAAALEDVERAAACPLADQDHVNQIFDGRLHLLDPAWNCSWGRLRRQRKNLAKAGIRVASERGGARVIHYHGPAKPWLPLAFDKRTRRRLPHILRYRLARFRFNRLFPALAF